MSHIIPLDTIEHVLLFLGTIVASSGFWMYMIRKLERKDSNQKLLMGLAHDRIMYLATRYIERGWIFPEEFENLLTYLYEPYVELGGNGAAKSLLEGVKKLPITPKPVTEQLDSERS